MAINERLVHTASAAAGAGSGNQEEGLILHLDANDVDSYDGDGSVWYDITNHEYKPATNVSEHFNTVLYTGTGASNQITGVGFQPDLIWVKNRAAGNHYIVDTLRGNGTSTYKNLSSNTTDVDGTTTTSGITNSTIVDGGFTMQGTGARTNASGSNYAAWCFKAGGAPSGSDKVSIDGTSYATMTAAGLTDGTEPISKLSVNTKLGFSIVKYTARALAVDTVAHGLGETPEMIILKSTSLARRWNVFHKDVGASKNLHLNTTDAANTDEYWTANSTTFSIQDYSASADWIAYAFTSKRGVSKVGSYEGTGTSGNKIYTGFEPAWLLIKNADDGGNWSILDNTRDTDGTLNEYLYPNTSDEEASAATATVKINRDGFTIGNSNSLNLNRSGDTFIYLAFAKDTNETELYDTDLEQHLDPANTNSYSGTGTSWNDLIGTHANATVVASAYDEELGNSFDLTNNAVTLSSDAGSLDGTSFTLETWLWQDNSSGTQYIFSDSGISFFTISGTQMRFIKALSGTYNDTGYFDPTSNGSGWGTNKWNHLAVTFSSTTAKFYINGTLVNTNTEGSGTGEAISTYQISPSVGRWKGKIGQYRVYSSALTQAQIRQNFNFTKNDYPNGYNGSVNGGVSWSADYFNFPATDGSTIRLPNESLKLNSFSVSMWVNPDVLPSSGYATFIENYEYFSASRGFAFYAPESGKLQFRGYNGDPASADIKTTNVVLSTGTWQHIGFVFDSGANIGKIYVNGDEVSSYSSQTTGTIGYVSSGHETTIGGIRHSLTSGDSESEFDGKISKVKVYDRAVDDSVMTANYTEGSGN